MKKNFCVDKNFIGHIGGDDFFVGVEKDTFYFSKMKSQIKTIIEKFNNEIILFYNADDISNKHYISKDRNGIEKKLPILSLSADIIEIQTGQRTLTQDDISQKLAELKKRAKKSTEKNSTI